MYMSRHEEEYEMILSPLCFQKDCNKTKVYNEEGEPVGLIFWGCFRLSCCPDPVYSGTPLFILESAPPL